MSATLACQEYPPACARWKTSSGRMVRNAPRTLDASARSTMCTATSSRMRVIRQVACVARLSRWTSYPRPSSARTRLAPMNPVPPVSATRVMFGSRRIRTAPGKDPRERAPCLLLRRQFGRGGAVRLRRRAADRPPRIDLFEPVAVPARNVEARVAARSPTRRIHPRAPRAGRPPRLRFARCACGPGTGACKKREVLVEAPAQHVVGERATAPAASSCPHSPTRDCAPRAARGRSASATGSWRHRRR